MISALRLRVIQTKWIKYKDLDSHQVTTILNYDVIILQEDNFTDQHDASNGHLHHIIFSQHTY